jgi:hypothetical protein
MDYFNFIFVIDFVVCKYPLYDLSTFATSDNPLYYFVFSE